MNDKEYQSCLESVCDDHVIWQKAGDFTWVGLQQPGLRQESKSQRLMPCALLSTMTSGTKDQEYLVQNMHFCPC